MLPDIEMLAARCGLAHVPLVVSARKGGQHSDWAGGVWPGGSRVVVDDRYYAASLAKQVTGAAIATLVRRGAIDVDQPVGAYLADLPDWRHDVTTRHLLHHLGGLPDLDPLAGPGHWTSPVAMARLRKLSELPTAPGAVYNYSNPGYICLAAIVAEVSGLRFDAFVQRELFEPLGLSAIGLDANPSGPQCASMGRILPLSLGDGGLWTSAPAFADWLEHQNRDTLGIAALTQQPGRLIGGAPTDYGWGIGIRALGGQPLFIHGGGWPGAYSKAVRSPALGFSIVALAATDDDLGVITLVDALALHLAG